MGNNISSRRSVVIGGLAIAGAIGPIAFARRLAGGPAAEPATFDDIALGNAPRREASAWEALVGQSFRIVGPDGAVGATLAAIEHVQFDPLRPEWLARSRSFYAYFTVGLSVAPAGQQSYAVLHPALGDTELFLGRGEDRGNEAVLYALFN